MLRASLEAVLAAARPPMNVDVLVNGNLELADGLKAQLGKEDLASPNASIRIWFIRKGDKAHAWNQYIHRIWSGEELAFFVDGYVRILSDSLQILGEGVLCDDQALGGSGVPSVGRTAAALRAQMLREGGFHGNLCCIRGVVVNQFRQNHFRIPLGLYRTDGLMGAVLSFGLNPGHNEWDSTRIHVQPRATWQTDEKYWWLLGDLKAKIMRLRRQAKGHLENRAIKAHFAHRRKLPEQLPATASELVRDWQVHYPSDVWRCIVQHPLTMLALRDIHARQNWAAAAEAPVLVWSSAKEPAAAIGEY